MIDRPFWVFDMDGTLTVPAHDFAAFKREHQLPEDQDLLGAALALGEPRRSAVLQAIRDWEDHLAMTAQAQADALTLLRELLARGGRLAVLTRNSRKGAFVTLNAAGLREFFPDDDLVLGRDCAPAKPAPDGIELLMDRAGYTPAQTVMVGDWVFDIQAGRNAGTGTVLVERHGPSPADWAPWADVTVTDLRDLLTP